MLKVEISAETQAGADKIIDALLEKRLVTGGQFIKTPSRFLWDGDVVDMDYITLTSFTLPENQSQIIMTVEEVSDEDVPMVVFLDFVGNPKLVEWIRTTCTSQAL